MKKLLAVTIILLFLSVSVIPSTGNMVFFDDTTPPVTTISFDPPYPGGENGWFVSDVEITLNATDDMSGVNATYYRTNEGEWETYVEPFVIESDGHYVIEYYSVDNAGNIEDVKSFVIKIDQTSPDLIFTWRAKGNNIQGWKITFIATCSDVTSGMNRAELYINDGLVSTDDKEPYEWTFDWSSIFLYIIIKVGVFDNAGNSDFDDNPWFDDCWHVRGLIYNPEISENNVTFFAVIVRYSYDDGYGIPAKGVHMFKRLTFRNDYEGYIGRFFIRATFY